MSTTDPTNSRIIEQLFMHIIKRYPSKIPDKQRLKQVKRALFGNPQKVGRPPLDGDETIVQRIHARLFENVRESFMDALWSLVAHEQKQPYDPIFPDVEEADSMRTMIFETAEEVGLFLSEHNREAFYRRILRKVQHNPFLLPEDVQRELEELLPDDSPNVVTDLAMQEQIITEILTRLGTLGIKV